MGVLPFGRLGVFLLYLIGSIVEVLWKYFSFVFSYVPMWLYSPKNRDQVENVCMCLVVVFQRLGHFPSMLNCYADNKTFRNSIYSFVEQYPQKRINLMAWDIGRTGVWANYFGSCPFSYSYHPAYNLLNTIELTL